MAGHGQGYYEALKVKKLFEKDLERVLGEIEKWEERHRLAADAGKQHLVDAAAEKLDDLRQDEQRCRDKLAEAEELLARSLVIEETAPELTPTDRAEMLQRDLDALVGVESKVDQETDEVSKRQKAAEDLERLKRGETDDDLADL
ncbi:hypothetical protein KAU45_06400 [bacterium]|nr:hypothetical protein [bacterium]